MTHHFRQVLAVNFNTTNAHQRAEILCAGVPSCEGKLYPPTFALQTDSEQRSALTLEPPHLLAGKKLNILFSLEMLLDCSFFTYWLYSSSLYSYFKCCTSAKKPKTLTRNMVDCVLEEKRRQEPKSFHSFNNHSAWTWEGTAGILPELLTLPIFCFPKNPKPHKRGL